MREKIRDNLEKGRYAQRISGLSSEAYFNQEGGWRDYLLSEKILFSHRENDYSPDALPEKLHVHDYYELTIIVGGEGVAYIADGQSISIHGGMAILTKPMHFHMFRLTAPVYYDRYVLYFKNIEGLFPDSAIMDFVKMGNDACAVFELSEYPLLSYVRAAENALSDRELSYSSVKAYLNICDMFLLLSDHKAVAEGHVAVSVPHFMNEIKEYIDENYLLIHSVEELSERFFYSREYISRSFRRYYNTPIYEYILDRKMLHCTALLRQGASVEAAAHGSGFGNMSSFIKLFRKMNRCTPSEYKAKHM